MQLQLQPLLGWISTEKLRLKHTLERSVWLTEVGIAAILAGWLGLAVLLVGAFVSLVEVMEPWQAGLIVGGSVILVVALTFWLIARAQRTSSHRLTDQPRHPLKTAEPPAAPELLQAAATEIFSHGNIRTMDVVIGALFVGLIVGANASRRSRQAGGHPDHRKG